MSRLFVISALAATMMVGVGGVASAAVISMSLKVTGTYSADGNTTLSSTDFINDGAAHIYRVDILASTTNQLPNESYGATALDLVLSGGLSRVAANAAGAPLVTPKMNYAANNPALGLVDSSSFATITNYFSGGQNGDIGLSTTDFIAITQAIDPSNLGHMLDPISFDPVPDPRQGIGVGTPFRLGVVYVAWNGTQLGTLTALNSAFSVATANPTGPGSLSDTLPAVIAPLPFVPVPEPASMVIMGLGGLGLVVAARRRRRS